MDISTGVVLAAGEGTRLRPLTRTRPKPMLPAAGRPILEHVLDVLVDCGIERLCIVVGYRRERIQSHFGDDFRGVPITYVHQKTQLGSAHALEQAAPVVDGPVLVVNGDRVIGEPIVDDVRTAFDGTPTLAAIEHPTPSKYGAVEVSDGRLRSFYEKPAPSAGPFSHINAGVYAFDRAVFETIERMPRPSGELQLPTVVETLLENKAVHAVETAGLWVDATYPWDLLAVLRELLEAGAVAIEEREPQVWVADSARVHEAATLQPPVVVGPDAEVAAGAVVGPHVAVGRNVTVGANTTVRDSLLDSDSRADVGSILCDCVLSEAASVGPGVAVPGGPGDIRVGDDIFEQQRLGAVIADRATVGGGATVTDGALIGVGATVAAGVVLEANVADEAEVVR
ncbi:sugar nucleotidyltransferase [Natronomonas pharaonis DSM 2160]|uniref:Bifunctional protein GlmU n=1 Tax=Natronomonas pharaonis (strain ATCC 35678 / DSM 2160 / CIP 103997 / JCM 8858 / NBRC 14720 / NCIMB 2260 / Gabara) TaxID=348780 RepID=A0A1U7EW38_NATPD|nr:sugar phosphate nucleotidyltransferase [Natronomonas pharaonis]CAI49284.1 sugar nucleotidyltransferase [Natronomonas pharaonis DSM 2160]